MCKIKKREVQIMNYKHIAYNKDTGEVISTTKSNHLKRLVERANRWAVRYGYPVGRWIFSHNGNPKI